jgi:CubicO group peptidase (beta-lactamase class C family)
LVSFGEHTFFVERRMRQKTPRPGVLISLLLAVMVPLSANPLNAANIAAPPPAPAGGPGEQLAERIDSFLAPFHNEGLFNGVVLVAEHGQVLFSKGYGLANIEWNVPHTPDTKFRIASLTKQFTAMLVLQSIADGKLRLDGTISEYLAEYPKENGGSITVDELLHHTAGIPEYTWTGDLINAQLPDRPADFIKRFSSLPLMFRPGSSFSYSNSGYYVLGVILERITGKPFEQLLHERILDPLGMRNSGYDHVEDVLPQRATGYLRVLAGRENPRYRYLDPARPVVYRAVTDFELPIYRDMITLYSAGAMYSTANDLVRWDRALAEGKLLPRELADFYFKPARSNYACGWFVGRVPAADATSFFEDFEGWRAQASDRRPSIAVEYHTGSVNGFISSIARLPDEDRVIIVLNNTGMTRLPEINSGILAVLHGATPAPPHHSLAEKIAHTMLEGGIEAGAHEFRDIRTRKDATYIVSANEISAVATTLTRLHHGKEAIALLELGTEAFPTSTKCLDGLADAYQASGNADSARASLRKLLAQIAGDTRLTAREREEMRRTAVERLSHLGDGNAPDGTSAGDSRHVGSPDG